MEEDKNEAKINNNMEMLNFYTTFIDLLSKIDDLKCNNITNHKKLANYHEMKDKNYGLFSKYSQANNNYYTVRD